MDLKLYEIIKGPRISTKVYRLNQELRQLVLDVHPAANKPMIKQALQALFNVQPQSIRVVVNKGKRKRSGRHVFTDALRKKAYVTLMPGQSIDMSNMASEQSNDAQGGA